VNPESAVLAANDAFYDAFARRDPAAMDVMWSRIHPLACIHPGWNALRTREEIIASWEAIIGNPNQPRVVSGGAEALVFGDTAVVICREFVGGAALLASNVFVNEDGRWRMVHHQSGPVAELPS
jgi:hypothetical protein